MTGISHLVVGSTVGFLVSKDPVAGLLLGGLGGVVVDLDAENSWLQVFLTRYNKPVWTNSWFGKRHRRDLLLTTLAGLFSLIEVGLRVILTAAIATLKLFVSHRGITHTLLSAFLVSGVVMVFNFNFGLVFLAGYLSHLVLDGMTKSGLSLFNPFSKKIIYLLPGKYLIKTGEISELVVVFIIVATSCFVFWLRKF